MFCPQCGASQSEELKFCKQCGANLQAVRQAVATRDAGGKIDWNRTWVAEMFLSEAEQHKRKQELERMMGITPEVKRYNEIKAGVITSAVGVGVMIFLSIIMEGIIASGQNPPSDAFILSRVWAAGLIPFFIGLALIINGLFVSKKIVAARERELRAQAKNTEELGPPTETPSLQAADTTEFVPTGYSVTEDTTKHLANQK